MAEKNPSPRKKKTTARKTPANKRTIKKGTSKEGTKKSSSWGKTAKSRAGRVKKAAEEALGDPKKLEELASKGAAKANRRNGKLGELADYLKAFIRLIRAYASGKYRAIPKDTMALIVAAVFYFVLPTDAIPDFLPGGFVDDAGVISFVLYLVKDEVDEFIEWEKKQKET